MSSTAVKTEKETEEIREPVGGIGLAIFRLLYSITIFKNIL